MALLSKKRKSLLSDFAIWMIMLAVTAYFTNLKFLPFPDRIWKSLLEGAAEATAITLTRAFIMWYAKRKIIYMFRRINPDEIDTCRELLATRKWRDLTEDEKAAISDIIDKTAFKYSY
jgi:hypothetical protein